VVEIVFCPILSTTTTPLIMITLLQTPRDDKQEDQLRCPHCSQTCIIRYGRYQRGSPEGHGSISIQRYLCKSRSCPMITFSFPPWPLLPIIRLSYSSIQLCYTLFQNGLAIQASIARTLKVTRGVAKRLISFCQRFIPWLEKEYQICCQNLNPEPFSALFWADFCRDFRHYFYPKRWLKCPPT
jgi:hypothetical protein